MPTHDSTRPLDQVQAAFPDMEPKDAIRFTETVVHLAQDTDTDVSQVIQEAKQANE